MDERENGSKLANTDLCCKHVAPPEGANAFGLQFSNIQEAPHKEPLTKAVKTETCIVIKSAPQHVFMQNGQLKSF